jgi:adenylate cyclase
MTDAQEQDEQVEAIWHTYLLTGSMPDFVGQPWYQKPFTRPIVRRLPAEPRCRLCHNPFHGVGGRVLRLFGVEPSRMNPLVCNICEQMAESFPGGTEIEVTLLFADVRGSTTLAEGMSPLEFSRLIDRFYRAVSHVIFLRGGMVEKLIGDEVFGVFAPGIAGENHAGVAVKSGRDILKTTGHRREKGPWVPVGVGIHTGEAYVGTVGEKGQNIDITALGDNVNTAARLASVAAAGEIVLSEATRSAAGLATGDLEQRRLSLKGKQEPVDAWALQIAP